MPRVFYIDVDDTFVRSFGAKRIPISSTLRAIRALAESGAELYCWSSGGADYARASAEEFGVADCFRAFLPKPQILIDDMPLSTWHDLREIHPAEVDVAALLSGG